MSVTTQIIFPYMSDARTPAMDVQMTAQDVGMLRSFSVSLSAMLIVDDGTTWYRLYEPFSFCLLSATLSCVLLVASNASDAISEVQLPPVARHRRSANSRALPDTGR